MDVDPHSPFGSGRTAGPRRASHCALRNLAPTSAKGGARCLLEEICNRRIVPCAHAAAGCARFGRAGLARRIRRAPARSCSPCDGEGASGDGRDQTTAGSHSLAGRFLRRCQAPPSPPMNDPDESRSIRPSGRSPHLPRWRPKARTPRALLHALSLVWTECLLDASRGFLPWPGPGGRGTPRRSTASVIRAASRARDLHAAILAEPPRPPG